MTDHGQLLDPSILQLLHNQDPLGQVKLYREYLAANYVLVKNSLIFELNNPALHQACARCAAVANIVRQIGDNAGSIAFLADGVYVNQNLLKISGGVFQQGEYLHAIWGELGVSEITAIAETSQADWLELSSYLKQAVVSSKERPFEDVTLERINLRMVELGHSGGNVSVSDRVRALRAYSLAYIAVDDLIRRLAAGSKLRVIDIKRALQQLIDVAEGCPDLLLALIHMKRHKIDLAHHLVNTAVLVITAALEMKLSRRDRVELAMQAALHDLGSAFTPEGTDEDAAANEWVRRWVDSATVHYRNLGRLVVANEIRLWVEPQPGQGNEYRWPVWSASRLIAVAHAYDQMTTARPGRPALLPDEATRILMAEAGRRYDPLAVKLLVNQVGVYPVGSTVALSDGRVAIVVEAPRGQATTPVVKIVRELSGNVVDGALVNLALAPGLGILRCVEPEEHAINTPAFLLG